jgi:uncharacterized protein (TIGR02996 family)
MTDTGELLERALVAQPEERVIHAAYADWLIETNDPRGEWIQLQLERENRSQPVDLLRELEQQAFTIRQRYEADWLGPLNQFVNPPRQGRSVAEPMEPEIQITWRRGWIFTIEINALREEHLQALASCRLTRLVQQVFLGISRVPAARVFAFLEENFPCLAHLVMHDEALQDDGVEALLSTGLFSRLKTLDLSRCSLTDDSALRLTGHRDAHRVDRLILEYNYFSPIGTTALGLLGQPVMHTLFGGLVLIDEENAGGDAP